MKLIRKKGNRKDSGTTIQKSKAGSSVWKILVIDDEADIHSMTRLALDGFEFGGKKLQILKAMSGTEAREILAKEPDIAVALVDVVMETDDAGLKLVDFIRNELKYFLIRVIIRTGQPGVAPEREVIERYDIDDYKDKTELTADKLYTTLRLALKSYRDLRTLDTNRKALTKILDAAPELYHPQSINQFFNGVLTQIIGLCNLGETGFISTINSGVVITAEEHEMVIQAGTGRFVNSTQNPEIDKIKKVCSDLILGKDTNDELSANTILIPLKTDDNTLGFIYLEDAQYLTKADRNLIHVMVYQCASALNNLQLYFDLKSAHQEVSQMLEIAEQARDMAESASRAKIIFLAKMSHELRTPLNAIIGYSDLIQEDAVDLGYKDIVPDLEKIQTAGKHLLGIISNVLDLSKIEANKIELHPSEFDINDLIQEATTIIQPIMESRHNRFDVEYHSKVKAMFNDRQKLKQTLLNLLSNAAKFTHHGIITFTVVDNTVDSENTSSDYVYFQIVDTGIGIASEKLETIFDPFTQEDDTTTRSFEGAGLGLSISQRFCQAMKGKISVVSTLDKGSTFTVKMPVKMDNSAQSSDT
ncbi:DUF3369 domain-containing protein [Candidatus Halobeggiatoa sp. HSG11]|nr:DUF3369 domain-containing protein [Candidatus Halobeggiatoa sp. HSG11]